MELHQTAPHQKYLYFMATFKYTDKLNESNKLR